MKNPWLQKLKKTYQLAFFKSGEWWHSLNLGTDINEAKRLFNLWNGKPDLKRGRRLRVIEHPLKDDPYAKYHVDKGKVIMGEE